jgi:glycosyltransferase involved in cell wall biosynthesis
LKLVFSNYDDLKNPYYAGGGARAIHEVAKRLAMRHDVVVLTGCYPGSQDEIVEGVRYHRIGCTRLGPKSGQLNFQFLLPWRVRQTDFDVWIESLTPPFSTACIQLFTKKPVVALAQILGGRAMGRKYGLPFGVVERIGLKSYRYAIAPSQFIRSELHRANPRLKIIVIPNGISEELIEQKVVKEDRHILFLGRIDVEQKGLDLLLNAYKEIEPAIQFPLIVAGSGVAKDEEFVTRRITELGLENRVLVIGRVAGREKKEALRQAAFFVMPSRFEAFPLAALEAFCYRLPVIHFAIPELDMLPEACCCKVEAFDESRFAKRMLTLAADLSLRHSMGAAAKSFVRDFNWTKLAGLYEQFLTDVIEVHRAHN